MSSTRPDEKRCCHRTGFEKSCRELVDSDKCQRWENILITNLQTEGTINRWGCSDDHERFLMMGMEAKLIAIQKAVESRGNETIKILAEGVIRQQQNHLQNLQQRESHQQQLLSAPQQLQLRSE